MVQNACLHIHPTHLSVRASSRLSNRLAHRANKDYGPKLGAERDPRSCKWQCGINNTIGELTGDDGASPLVDHVVGGTGSHHLCAANPQELKAGPR